MTEPRTPSPVPRIPSSGFTLIETMVALVVFTLIILAAGDVFISIQQSWQGQKAIIDMVQNARWAEEFMSNEIREGRNVNAPSGDRLRFWIDPNADGNPPFRQVEYRRQGTVLYRRWRQVPGFWQPYQELANLIVDNPDGNNIFDENGGVVTIELTVNKDNRNYTLRTKVRPRNQ